MLWVGLWWQTSVLGGTPSSVLAGHALPITDGASVQTIRYIYYFVFYHTAPSLRVSRDIHNDTRPRCGTDAFMQRIAILLYRSARGVCVIRHSRVVYSLRSIICIVLSTDWWWWCCVLAVEWFIGEKQVNLAYCSHSFMAGWTIRSEDQRYMAVSEYNVITFNLNRSTALPA